MTTRLSQVPLTELDVVNKMLRAIKEEAVSGLSEPVTPDVETALGIFSDFNIEFQDQGWHFNTEYNVTLARDATNEIVLAPNILSVKVPSRDIALRGLKLYDKANNTFVFTQDITDACTTTLLDFDQLPSTARTYVSQACARLMQEEVFTDQLAERINVAEEQKSWASLVDDEAERAGSNMGTGNIDMYDTIHRYRGRTSNIWLR